MSNFIFSYTQNKVISLLNSKKFEYFMIQRFNQLLENLAKNDLSQSEIDYYSNLYLKLKKKFDPIILDAKQK